MGRSGKRALGAIASTLVAALALVPAAEAKLHPGDLLVTTDDDVRQVVADTGAVRVFAQDPLLQDPSELAFTPNGKVIVTDEDAPAIFRVSKQGDVRRFVGAGENLESPYGAAYSPTLGVLVADYSFDPNPALLRVRGRNDVDVISDQGSFQDPIGVAVSPSGRNYVIEQDFFTGDCGTECGGVIRVSRNGSQDPISTGGAFVDPTDGIFDSRGRLYVSDQDAVSDGAAYRVNPVTGTQTPVAADSDITGNGIAIELDGSIILTTDAGVAQAQPDDSIEEIVPIPNDANDVAVVPPTCFGKWATIFGTTGKDRVTASPGKDVIATLGGDDVVRGAGGKDLICGGAGADRLNGQNGRDRVNGGPGNDRCRAERERSC